MIGLIALVLAGAIMLVAIRRFASGVKDDISSPKASERLNRLWRFVDKAAKGGRKRTLEKALLSILKLDHKNTAAYNRLGVLYAKEGNFDDAIDCFAIASSLTPTLATLYNLGLVHFEKGNYKEAANAFERVVDLEPNVKRYIAYAKALLKLENPKKVSEVLEKVVQLEPTAPHYDMLAQIYNKIKDYGKSDEARRQAAILRAKKLGAARKRETSLRARLTARRVS